jgi:hypothetical protein
MVRYVKSVDELIALVDKEFSGNNAVCPLCKNEIGTVNIQDIEGINSLKFMQFRYPGLYCTQGHCLISMEEDRKVKNENVSQHENYKVFIEDLGLKVFEVIKLIKPYLDIEEGVPNTQLYWMLMDKGDKKFTKNLNYEDALDILDKLQRLGARAGMIESK